MRALPKAGAFAEASGFTGAGSGTSCFAAGFFVALGFGRIGTGRGGVATGLGGGTGLAGGVFFVDAGGAGGTLAGGLPGGGAVGVGAGDGVGADEPPVTTANR